MVGRLLLIYAVVELMAVIGLAAAIGFGWTVLVLLAAFILGLVVWAPMGGWQLSRKFVQLRSGLTDPRSALGDGALVTVATGLVTIPGLVTTAIGLLLLIPPVRAVVRPGLAAIAGRGFQQRISLITDVPAGTERRDYIDGEVIDVIDVEPPVLPYGR
ncbi:FxsA family protein [Mycobacterium szulgai]|uniref:Exclusion suppressor FxsA n=1 Tax=Mycobacterium szulgai TaxID=1787 RepID=A0A1X2EHA5_MYCSZ|nr:FxsA family protein [Mycobacterium szulgai]MCV7079101.1 FxsA family protein [Mycobacterium szulgai]ORX01728.1 exclusion suppressor FxsA [Mycobacterium szulgai]